MPSSRDQPGSTNDDTSAGQLSVPEFLVELSALISEIESARGGSQSLDIRIHHGFRILGGHGEDMASLLIREGVSWPVVQETLNEIVPAYSTSLDASLQGEEIVFAIRSAKGQRWGAMQRTASGGEELAWAATEPLARRLAALKCWHAELEKSLEDDDNLSGQMKNYQFENSQADISDIGESATINEESGLTGVESEHENSGRDVTPLHDRLERVKGDEPDQSDKEEQDWKILF
jgi:hypothetical protein